MSPPHQHVGEANPTDDLLLLVALDEAGKLTSFTSGDVARSIFNGRSLLNLSLLTCLLSILFVPLSRRSITFYFFRLISFTLY